MAIVSLSGQYASGGYAAQSAAGQTGEVGQKAQLNAAQVQSVTEMVNRDYHAGKFDLFDPSICLNYDDADVAAGDMSPEGKTVVQNQPTGWIITTIDPNVTTADDARKSAKAGGATHAFLYQTFDFLTDAAKEYTTLGEDEVFQHRNINDLSFVRDTLSFFTDEDYYKSGYIDETQSTLMDQMTDVVHELAQQIKDGENPDLSKVKTTLTIGGTDVTVAQLMEMQQVGRELSESFKNVGAGSLNGQNTEAFAKMGIAKTLGSYYGGDKGEIGTMFSAAIDRLYERGITQVQKGQVRSQSAIGVANTSGNQNAVRTELNIADMFSKMDSSSKTSLSNSFSSALSQMRALVQQYCGSYGMLTSHVGLAGVTDNVSKFFQNWMEKL